MNSFSDTIVSFEGLQTLALVNTVKLVSKDLRQHGKPKKISFCEECFLPVVLLIFGAIEILVFNLFPLFWINN